MSPQIIRIDSANDQRITDYRSLTDVSLRRRIEPVNGIFMAESQPVIARAIAAGFQPRTALTLERWLPQLLDVLDGRDIDVFVGRSEVLREITGYRVHRGALAAFQRKPLPSVEEVLTDSCRVVVLEGIVDHTNVGAIFRSVAALGIDAVLIDPTCADPLYRRSVRVSMGAVFSLPWTRLSAWPSGIEALRGNGFVTAALTPDSHAEDISTWAVAPPTKVALLLGTEGDGLSHETVASADVLVRIPMSNGVDSLNVAAATAVACFALRLRPCDEGRSEATE